MIAARLSITKTLRQKVRQTFRQTLDKTATSRRRTTLAVLAGALFFSSFMAPLVYAAGAVSPAVDPDNGFPLWYEDVNGVRVGQCVDGADAGCVLPGLDEGFDPESPTAFPSNFPVEHFYHMAMSRAIPTPGGGDISVEFAVEGAFLNDEVVAGDQMVFGRIRVVGDGLQPNSTYTITHPYGVDTYATDVEGQIDNGTQDIGCGESPCNFSAALQSRVFNGFLISTSAPAGYLGDNLSETTVTGGPLRQTVTITGPGLPAAGLTTDRFTVSGKRYVATAPCSDAAPSAATLSDPANGATNVSTSPALRWTASASFGTNCNGAANGYQIFLSQGATANPTAQAGAVGPNTTTFTPTGLQPNSTYSWKVRTTNGALTADSAVFTFTTATNSPPPVLGASSTPVYRMYNGRSGDHFYTSSAAERDRAIATYGYQSEGIGFYASDTANSRPVHRMYNSRSGDHFYTSSAAERDRAIATYGYISEGIAYYASETTTSNPVHRLLNVRSGDHFYTSSAAERDRAISTYGYQSEGIGFYAMQ